MTAQSHIIPNPAGTWSIAGHVPESALAVSAPPTRSQAMGRRTFERDGVTYGWDTRPFPTFEAAAEAVRAGGGALCDCCKEPRS